MAHARNTFKGCQICLGAIYLFPSCLKHDGVKSASSFSSILLDPSNCHSSCRSSGQTWLWNWSQGLKDLHISRSSPALLASLPVPEWTSSNFPVWRFIIAKSFFGSSQAGCFVQSLSWGRRGGVRFRRRQENDVLHTMPDIDIPQAHFRVLRVHLAAASNKKQLVAHSCHVWPLCLSARSRDHLRQSSLTMVKSLVMHVTVQENVSAWFTTVQCAAVLCLDMFGSISFHSYYMQTKTPGLHVPLAALLFFHFKDL